ncbi:MAG: cobyric acid synthase [Nitrospinae bacterium]|nr:cobyric acid synthase [Nitrospinota bacterium]
MSAPCIAVFGTGSDVGKSVVASALCRIFSDMGINVAPYKAQNMSNNSFVTPEGGEIGRAQAVQAECARLAPHTDMNPLLLKPSADSRSQMVLHGKAAGETTSADFRTNRDSLFDSVQESLRRLRAAHELVVIEGAGSCAEVNLRSFDIANFRTALSCGAAVILVADISRGGVFAQILGTLALLLPEERALVKGIIVNRFRGDLSLFKDGVDFIEQQSGIPVLGVIPSFSDIVIDSEDSVLLDALVNPPMIVEEGKTAVAVIRLPHISNFTDFAPLVREPSVRLSYLSRPRPLDGVDLLILPGSKNTIADLMWLRETGWEPLIREFASKGGKVGGICGGYQMLGMVVDDPHGMEGEAGRSADGLGLLHVKTVLGKKKRLARATALWNEGKEEITGYEIHMGITEGNARPFAIITENGKPHHDGAVSDDGRVWGTYLHGLFDEPEFRKAFLATLGKAVLNGDAHSRIAFKERQYDLLAAYFKQHLNMEKLIALAGIENQTVTG